jgi:hypothetical protein
MSSTPPGEDILVDGTKVIIRNLEIDSPELATYLSSSDSPDHEQLLIDLIKMGLDILRMTKTSADIKELDSVAKQVNEAMKNAGENAFNNLDKLIRDQADDRPGTLISLLKSKLVTDVIQELDPDKETSPFHKIRQNLQDLLRQSGREETAKDKYAKSREKGGDFEDLVYKMVQEESSVHGDDALFTGGTTTAAGSKKGDVVVTLNHDVTSGIEIKIAWEAKTNVTFKQNGRLHRQKVKEELISGVHDREAVCGVFVSDARQIDPEKQPVWQEFDGNKLIIVIDDDDPDQRLVRLAYLWSRWVALRSQSKNINEIDFDAIVSIIESLRTKFSKLSELRKNHTLIEQGLTKAKDWTNSFKEEIDDLLDHLQTLTIDKEKVVEE